MLRGLVCSFLFSGLDAARLAPPHVANQLVTEDPHVSLVDGEGNPNSKLMAAPRTLSATPYARGSAGVEHAARRVEFQTLTVDDLTTASVFYREVLGAVEVDFCKDGSTWCTDEGYVRFSGDAHSKAMFSLDNLQEMPDISARGDSEVHSRFFSLRNSLVQLIAFVSKQDGKAQSLRDPPPHRGPTFITNSHICFWVEDGVDANLYVEDVENRSKSLGLDVKFNRPVPQTSEQDRASIPKDRWADCSVGGVWEGQCWGYFKGPLGEQYEIYTLERSFKQAIGRAFCERGGASPAFLATGTKCKGTYCNVDQKEHLSQRLHGVFQQGFRSRDLLRAVGFYTEVLGGDLISHPAQGRQLMQSDAFQWSIFANETLEAWAYAQKHGISRTEAQRLFGIPDLSPAGTDRLDHSFILFDNFVVEPLEYSAGLTYGADGFDPELNRSSSPAYVGTIVPAFGVGVATMQSYLTSLRQKLQRQGFASVAAPLSSAAFSEDHPYHGLEYAFSKGPDGEALAFVRLDGRFREAIREAFLKSGVVSTLFDETNAFENGDMSPFCRYATDVPQYGAYEIPGSS